MRCTAWLLRAVLFPWLLLTVFRWSSSSSSGWTEAAIALAERTDLVMGDRHWQQLFVAKYLLPANNTAQNHTTKNANANTTNNNIHLTDAVKRLQALWMVPATTQSAMQRQRRTYSHRIAALTANAANATNINSTATVLATAGTAEAGTPLQVYIPSLDRPFIFFHIPKTGGTSLREFLFKEFFLRILPPPPNHPTCVPGDPLIYHDQRFREEQARYERVKDQSNGSRSSSSSSVVVVVAAAAQNGLQRAAQRKEQLAQAVQAELGRDDKHYTKILKRHPSRPRDDSHRSLAMSKSLRDLHQQHRQRQRDGLAVEELLRLDQSTADAKTRATAAATADEELVKCAAGTIPYHALLDSRASTVVPCYNCPCNSELAEIRQQASCGTVFLGHYYPYSTMTQLLRIDHGMEGPLLAGGCHRWRDLRSLGSPPETTALTASDPLFWAALDRTRCATVVRNPFTRAISGYYQFGFPETNLTAREYIDRFGVQQFLYISSSYVNGQTAILGGQNNPELVNRDTLRHAKRLLQQCIVGVQENMNQFVEAVARALSIPPYLLSSMRRWNEKDKKTKTVSKTRLAMDMVWFRVITMPFLSLDMELWSYAGELATQQRELLFA
jgi:hypothetical protein